LYHQG